MNDIITGTIVLLLLLLCSCSKQKELNCSFEDVNGQKVYKNKNIPAVPNLKIKTKELFTIKGYDDEFADDSLRIITDINSIDLDSKGNIYLLSTKTATIKKFDKSGNFIKSFGKMGNGPGETKWPQNMYIQNDTINVLNQQVLQMVKYDTDGNFLINASTKECKMPVYTKRVGNNRLITYLCNWRREDDGMFMDYDLGLVTSEYDVLKRLKEQSYSGEEARGYIDLLYGNTVTENKLYVASNSESEYLIDAFDFDGNKLYSIKKTFMKIKADEETIKASKNKKKFKNAIYELLSDKDNRVWALIAVERNEANKDDLIVDIFENGIFLNRTKLDIPASGSLRVMGNRLYSIDYENMDLKVYEYEVTSEKDKVAEL